MTIPAVTPLTTPEVFTVATEVVPELQVPPLTVLLSVVLAATHTRLLPVMVPAAGAGFTVMFLVALADPQLLVTV